MPAIPLLLADWGQLIVLAIVFLLWAGGQVIKLLTKAMKPPQAPGGNVGNPPRPPVARPQAVDDEIEEFLRRAAQNRPGQPARPQPAVPQAAAQQRAQQMAQRPQQQPQRPQQQQRPPQQQQRPPQQQRGGAGRPAAQPQSRPPQQRRPSVVQAVEVVEERSLSGGGQSLGGSLDRRAFDDDPSTQTRVEYADDLMQQHIAQSFNHKLGQLGGSASGQPSDPSIAGQPVGFAPSSGATALAALLANPGSMRTAIILHEILQPRDFDRDFPLIPAEQP